MDLIDLLDRCMEIN